MKKINKKSFICKKLLEYLLIFLKNMEQTRFARPDENIIKTEKIKEKKFSKLLQNIKEKAEILYYTLVDGGKARTITIAGKQRIVRHVNWGSKSIEKEFEKIQQINKESQEDRKRNHEKMYKTFDIE